MGTEDEAPQPTHPAQEESGTTAPEADGPEERPSGDEYLTTLDRISLVSWGDGSAPSLPSLADDETLIVCAFMSYRLLSFICC